MAEMRRLTEVGGCPVVFLKKRVLEFMNWKKGDVICVDYGNDRIIMTKMFGVTAEYNPKLIKINRKDL